MGMANSGALWLDEPWTAASALAGNKEYRLIWLDVVRPQKKNRHLLAGSVGPVRPVKKNVAVVYFRYLCVNSSCRSVVSVSKIIVVVLVW